MPNNFIKSLSETIEQNTPIRHYEKWEKAIALWTPDRRQKFFNAMNNLSNHSSYRGKSPKIIGRYTTEPYRNTTILVFGTLTGPSQKFENDTNNLRIKLDGTEYSIRDNSSSHWISVKI